MITERKIYTTTDGTEFDENDYFTPEEAKTRAEQHEAEYQHKRSLIGKDLIFRDAKFHSCRYDGATFVAILTDEAIDVLQELCDDEGYYTPWDDCNDAFEAKTGFFMYDDNNNYWVDMDMEIEKILAAKATMVGEKNK